MTTATTATTFSIAAMNALPAHVALIDEQGTIAWVNRAWRHFADENGLRDPNYSVGTSYVRICGEAEGEAADEAPMAESGVTAVLRGDIEEYSLDYPCHSPNEERWFRLLIRPLDDPALRGAVVMHINITETKIAERSSRIFKAAIESAADVVMITDPRGRVEYVNPAFTTVTGFDTTEVLGRELVTLRTHASADVDENLARALRDASTWEAEVVGRRRDGSQFWGQLSIAPVRDDDGSIARFVAVEHDITDRKMLEERLRMLALHDSLTGLPNRLLLLDRLGQAIRRLGRERGVVALLFIDLDGFKAVNDRLGHDAGNRLLNVVAERLRGTVRSTDTVARLGGDEFVVLLQHPFSAAPHVPATQAAMRIIQCVSEPVVLDGSTATVTPSIGIVTTTTDETTADTLLELSDQAMYAAKRSGKGRFHLYQEVSDGAGSGEGA